MASKSLKDLQPKVQLMAEEFVQKCAEAGIEILIYCTLRSKEEQNVLYAQGRTTDGKIVTNARGGDSWHNYGCAFDWVPVIAGKLQWDNMPLYARAGIIAESVGLEWAGRWTGKLKETAHCQFRDGRSLDDMKKGG